jgi:outer membrane lipoprotein carrier protein
VEAPAPLTAAEDPEIAAVLRRAAGVYAGARSLQADFSQRSMNPILRTTVASQGTLYQRRPDRFLMRFSDPAGDLIVSDGSHFWVFYPSVDRKQVLRMPASMGAGGVDLQAQFVGDPLERFTAVSEGREEISGRSSYVLLLTPRQPIGYRSLKIWVDPEDYLVRRFEVTEESGIVRHFELSNLRLNPTLSDDLFRFTPPEGAQVVDRG